MKFVTLDQNHQGYHSYLLRLWQVRVETGVSWRASLEDVQTGELHGFSKPEDLIGYLNTLTQSEGKQPAVVVYQEESL